MQRLIQTVAMTAALVAVSVSLWENYGLWVALKRAIISYLAFYFITGLLALVYKAGVLAESGPPAETKESKAAGPPENAD